MHIRLSKQLNQLPKLAPKLIPDLALKPTQARWHKKTAAKHVLKSCVALAALLVSATSSAEQQYSPEFTLEQVIAKSLQQHPELVSYSYLEKAAQGAAKQAGVSSPMTLDVKVEDVLGSGEYSEFSSMQTSISIAWLLEGDLINARVNYAQQQTKLTELNKQSKALDIAANTANFYITLLAQKEQLKLAKLSLTHAKEAYVQVNKRVVAGKSHVVDKLRAQADVAKKDLVVEDLNHEIEASRASLAAQWQGNSDFTVSGSLADIPSMTTVNNAYEKLKNHPKFKQLAAEQRISESAVALAKANETPAWKFIAGVKHDELSDDVAVTAGVSIPFGSDNRNLGQILELEAKQGSKQAELDAWQKKISTELLLITHKLKHNRHVIEGLGQEIIPALDNASNSAEDAYRVGRYRYSEWYDVQQDLIDAQFELIDAYSNIHRLNIELERLTGTTITL